MNAFDFLTSRTIRFGAGRLAELGRRAAEYASRVLLVTGGESLARSGRLAQVEQLLREAGLVWRHVSISGEPTTEAIDRLTAEAREFAPKAVIAIGGGSVLDAGKALAALLANGGVVLDYLEGVGRGQVLNQPALPVIAVPTTAGTGSEVTKNAVLGDEARTYKRSLRADAMLPVLALVDPELTYDCPPAVTAASGMDAIAQLLEAYTSRNSNPLTDALATQGLTLAGELPFLAATPDDTELRDSMALASLLGGMSLANAGLGAVHGLASPLGAFFQIPHGAICAALLPPVVRRNAERGLEAGDGLLLLKYQAAYEVLAGLAGEDEDDEDQENNEPAIPDVTAGEWQASSAAPPATPGEQEDREELDLAYAAARQFSRFLADLNQSLGLRGLGGWGVRRDDFPRIIAEARGTSMKTNPVALTDADLAGILEAAL